MSFYRTLTACLPCGHCGMEREVLVQFRTGTDPSETCREGAKTDLEDLTPLETALIPGVEYTGVADFYCPPCLIRRKTDEFDAFYTLLSGWVSEGRLLLRRGLLFKRPLEASALQRQGKQLVAEFNQKPDPKTPLFEGLRSLEIYWQEKPARPGSMAHINFIETINHHLASELALRGWTRRTLLRDDIGVMLNHERKIQVSLRETRPEASADLPVS